MFSSSLKRMICCSRRQRNNLFFYQCRSIRQSSLNIFFFQGGVVLKDLLFADLGSQVVENNRDHDARSFDTCFSVTYLRIADNSFLKAHVYRSFHVGYSVYSRRLDLAREGSFCGSTLIPTHGPPPARTANRARPYGRLS